MKTRSFPALLVALILAGLAARSPAATNVAITTVINNAGTNYTFWLGSGQFNNTLFITNGGQLTNVAAGIIGPHAAAGTNHGLLVSGPGSTWQSSSTLQIGENANGHFNWMTISNAGVVTSLGGLAIGGSASSTNRVVVTGSGSVWSNTGSTRMIIGNNGSGNSLTISDSGTVVSAGAIFGNNNATSRGNWALVTGSGSVWNASGGAGAVVVGGVASSQQLIISNGGTVLSATGRTGGEVVSSSSGENFVLVTGAGSLWTNTTTLTIGFGLSSRDRMEIRDGGRVTSTAGTIGNAASNSSVLVTDPGSLWFMGANQLTLGAGWGHSLVISNQGAVRAGAAAVGTGAGSSNNTLLVTGAGSTLTNTGILTVGYNGGSNLLRVTSGGTVVSGDGRLGFNNVNSRNNLAIVEGTGSLWNAGTSLTLGSTSAGPSNRVSVIDGGTLLSGNAAIGQVASTFNNSVTVSGTGSVWRAAGTITAGAAASSNNFMLVTDGGLVESSGLVTVASIGNFISNSGGTFQFTTKAPTITAGSAGSIVLANGALGFRGITNGSPVLSGTQLTNLTFVGNNAFRLDTATNAADLGSYKFDSVANTGVASNFQRLVFAGNGSLWRSSNLWIGAGGAIVGSGTIQANMVTNQGTFSPGNSPGLLTFTSNLTLLSSSVLNMELAGTNSSQFDHIAVGGAFALDGTLNVSLIDGFTPQAGNTFKLFDFPLLSGTFSTTNFGALAEGLAWDTSNLYITGTLGVLNAIPEPGAAALLGIAGLLVLLRRRSGCA